MGPSDLHILLVGIVHCTLLCKLAEIQSSEFAAHTFVGMKLAAAFTHTLGLRWFTAKAGCPVLGTHLAPDTSESCALLKSLGFINESDALTHVKFRLFFAVHAIKLQQGAAVVLIGFAPALQTNRNTEPNSCTRYAQSNADCMHSCGAAQRARTA